MALFSFTKKADYGLVMLSALAVKGKGQTVSVRELVENNGLPRAFTAQIGKSLVEAGILGSKEGRGGGYYLKKNPENVAVKQALVAIEGEIAPTECVAGGGGRCAVGSKCKQKGFMNRIAREIGLVLEGYSLADLVEK